MRLLPSISTSRFLTAVIVNVNCKKKCLPLFLINNFLINNDNLFSLWNNNNINNNDTKFEAKKKNFLWNSWRTIEGGWVGGCGGEGGGSGRGRGMEQQSWNEIKFEKQKKRTESQKRNLFYWPVNSSIPFFFLFFCIFICFCSEAWKKKKRIWVPQIRFRLKRVQQLRTLNQYCRCCCCWCCYFHRHFFLVFLQNFFPFLISK